MAVLGLEVVVLGLEVEFRLAVHQGLVGLQELAALDRVVAADPLVVEDLVAVVDRVVPGVEVLDVMENRV